MERDHNFRESTMMGTQDYKRAVTKLTDKFRGISVNTDTKEAMFVAHARLLGLAVQEMNKEKKPEEVSLYQIGQTHERVSSKYIGVIDIDPKKHQIVCAAVRGDDGRVLSGIRHYSHEMKLMILESKANKENFLRRQGCDLGFLDNYGIYRTREQAFLIAQRAGQIDVLKRGLEHLWKGRKLFSEMLY